MHGNKGPKNCPFWPKKENCFWQNTQRRVDRWVKGCKCCTWIPILPRYEKLPELIVQFHFFSHCMLSNTLQQSQLLNFLQTDTWTLFNLSAIASSRTDPSHYDCPFKRFSVGCWAQVRVTQQATAQSKLLFFKEIGRPRQGPRLTSKSKWVGEPD